MGAIPTGSTKFNMSKNYKQEILDAILRSKVNERSIGLLASHAAGYARFFYEILTKCENCDRPATITKNSIKCCDACAARIIHEMNQDVDDWEDMPNASFIRRLTVYAEVTYESEPIVVN